MAAGGVATAARGAGGAAWRSWVLAALSSAGLFAARRGDEASQSGQQSGPQGRSDAERAAFGRLFARYSAALLDYLFGMTRDREAAADLVQETFVRALAARTALETIEYPQAWLYRIATNAALSAGRRGGRFRWLRLAAVEPEAGADDSDRWAALPRDLPRADDVAVAVVERDAVWTVLAELPPRWRAVLLLQAQGGFSVAEIAELLTLHEANVRKMLFRAKERFRSLYRGPAESGDEGRRA
jgi:RNA polymerase sigma-70 factor, ECF subfamily